MQFIFKGQVITKSHTQEIFETVERFNLLQCHPLKSIKEWLNAVRYNGKSIFPILIPQIFSAHLSCLNIIKTAFKWLFNLLMGGKQSKLTWLEVKKIIVQFRTKEASSQTLKKSSCLLSQILKILMACESSSATNPVANPVLSEYLSVFYIFL